MISLNLGIDFGTKYTKVCVRDTDRDESWVVIPGKGKSYLEAALIVSQVGIRADGTLVAGLTELEWQREKASCEQIKVVDFLKMRLAHLDPGRQHQYWYSPRLPDFQGNNLSSCNAVENLCAFFLYRVIQRSKKWIYRNDPDRLKNVGVDWSVQIGVPVEYSDSPSLERFIRILCLAWHFCEIDIADVTFNELNDYLDDIRKSLNIEETRCLGVPEIAAAVYSYTYSRQARQGVYVFFDIGGGTTEGAAFKFYRTEDDESKIDFLSGSVEPIGIDALAKRITEYSDSLELKVARAIAMKGDLVLDHIDKLIYKKFPHENTDYFRVNKYQISETKFFREINIARKELKLKLSKGDLVNHDIEHYLKLILIASQRLIHRQVSTVICSCYDKLPPGKKPGISIFMGGGGKISDYYRVTIEATYDTFKHGSRGIPRYRMLDVPRPRDFDMKGIAEQDFHRFSIAYGLSIPDYQAPEFKLPSNFANTPPPPTGPAWIPETAHDDG